MVQFNRRRFFPEKTRRLPLRWITWAAIVVLFLAFLLFMKMFR